MNNTKTVFRTYIRTVILKSTFFESTLISQGKKSYKEEVNKWLELIKEKAVKIEGDYIYKPIIRKNSFRDKQKSLNHGIEKEISQIKIKKNYFDLSLF